MSVAPGGDVRTIHIYTGGLRGTVPLVWGSPKPYAIIVCVGEESLGAGLLECVTLDIMIRGM